VGPWTGWAHGNRIKSVEAPRGEFAIEDLQTAMPREALFSWGFVEHVEKHRDSRSLTLRRGEGFRTMF